ncbi:hypothetical protein GOBAR_AA00508 [Gossypium barbadense]|uniref:Uncharacterized protein n=1 Tax=Gossypium barbadense TaxID=3634 RepID=A0A2P5YWT0_GOSBA|nr:hypothetical protein GOBAR_AA00508 [Gossypium barbadense]
MEEQQPVILNGLLLEFDQVVSIITMSRVPFDLQGFTIALLDAKTLQQGHLSRVAFSANVAVVNKNVLAQNVPPCGQQVTMEEQQYAILNGLPPQFDYVVSIITTSRVPFDLQGVTIALLDVEA